MHIPTQNTFLYQDISRFWKGVALFDKLMGTPCQEQQPTFSKLAKITAKSQKARRALQNTNINTFQSHKTFWCNG